MPDHILSRRRVVLTAIAVAWGSSASAKSACAPIRVLFVCPAGSVKSAIAREALRRLAVAEHLPVSVSSRGISPEDHLTPALVANLTRDGLDPGAEPLRKLAPSDISAADVIIAFDGASDEPMLRSARSWKTPSWNERYAAAKADLDERLIRLVAELKARDPAPCPLR